MQVIAAINSECKNAHFSVFMKIPFMPQLIHQVHIQ